MRYFTNFVLVLVLGLSSGLAAEHAPAEQKGKSEQKTPTAPKPHDKAKAPEQKAGAEHKADTPKPKTEQKSGADPKASGEHKAVADAKPAVDHKVAGEHKPATVSKPIAKRRAAGANQAMAEYLALRGQKKPTERRTAVKTGIEPLAGIAGSAGDAKTAPVYIQPVPVIIQLSPELLKLTSQLADAKSAVSKTEPAFQQVRLSPEESKMPPKAAAEPLQREVLTNESVVKLAEAGFSELFIANKIRMSKRSNFDSSVEGLIFLRRHAVSEDLIHYILQCAQMPSDTLTPTVVTEVVVAEPKNGKKTPRQVVTPAPVRTFVSPGLAPLVFQPGASLAPREYVTAGPELYRTWFAAAPFADPK